MLLFSLHDYKWKHYCQNNKLYLTNVQYKVQRKTEQSGGSRPFFIQQIFINKTVIIFKYV